MARLRTYHVAAASRSTAKMVPMTIPAVLPADEEVLELAVGAASGGLTGELVELGTPPNGQ